jgi:xanthine dehydrogenase/oxidase
MVSSFDPVTKKISHRSVNACLAPLCSVDGLAVTTVEGIGSVKRGLDVVQEKISSNHGSQCGFCTPGIVMSVYTQRRANPAISEEQLVESLDGNLCRCTGYRPLVESVKQLAGVCPSSGKPCSCDKSQCGQPVEPDYEYIFPPKLILRQKNKEAASGLKITQGKFTWWRPNTLEQLLDIKKEHHHAKIIVGNTEVGIETKFKNFHYTDLVSPALVSDLHVFDVKADHLVIGASVPLADLQKQFQRLKKELPKEQVAGISAVLYQLKWFAGNQIRNVACVGGNIATASPISDLNPVWIATNSTINLRSATTGARSVSMREFFVSYRKTVLKADEIIVSITMPLSREKEFVRCYKQARRKEDDIAVVSSCFRLMLDKENKVSEVCLSFGGMAAKAVFCQEAETYLKGKNFLDEKTFKEALEHMAKDVPLTSDAVGGMAGFRRTLTSSFFFKFYQFVMAQVDPNNSWVVRDAFVEPHRKVTSGKQVFADTNEKIAPVTVPLAHVAAKQQTTGEAVYVDDMPQPARGLYAHFVMAGKPNANFSGIDADIALKMPGVVAFYSAKDIPGLNEIGPVFTGEELFASSQTKFAGHPVGIVVASTHQQARDAARYVEINWGQESKPILSMEDAIEARSFHQDAPHFIEKGDVAGSLKKAKHVVKGEITIGAQEHFYLEPQGSFVVPGEDNEFEVFASSQNPTKTQMKVAGVLGVPASKVVARTKRMGGGFGGKETRSIFVSAACAVASYHLHRPVRMILDRDVDFSLSGTRHAFRGNYEVGFDDQGIIEGVDVNLYCNAGYSMDLSFSVMERALFHSLNAYKCGNIRAVGHLCKTNLLTATAFRGFGGPQGMMVCETWIDHIARELNLPIETVRERNLVQAGDLSHYNQEFDPTVRIKEVYSKLREQSEFDARQKKVEEYNAGSRYRKRGICLLPTVFGMSFTAKFMNQAGALVHCYQDGSVQVHHGGTEMGQGLHTKVAQVAAAAFGIEMKQVRILETATDKVANTSPTAASVSSDINGAAVLDACNQINERLAPLRKEFPEASHQELCLKAHLNSINLSAQGFYKTPDLSEFNFLKKVAEGDVNHPFNYYSQGAAVTEVELDTLTGDFSILRTDILMDVGNSINPTLDIGQVEGAFVQGMGWCTMEELVWMKNGNMFTRGPGAYKIPGFADTPQEFNVSLLQNNPNIRAIHSSKGVGEPPFFLGGSTFFALKSAVYAARAEEKLTGFFNLQSPATAERLRMACQDQFTKQFEDTETPHKEFFFLL